MKAVINIIEMSIRIVGVVAIALLVSKDVFASDGVWVFCNNCSTVNQFESAAVGAMDRTGYIEFEVANMNSGVVWRVAVTGTRLPGVPTGTDPVGVMSQGPAEKFTSADQLPDAVPTGPVYVNIDWSFPESDAVNDAFRRIVAIFKKDPLWVSAPDGSNGFSSFYGRDPEAVNTLVFETYTQNNPSWQASEIPSLSEGLVNALKSHFGRGPTVCVAFENGDAACFQLNPMDPKNAIVYIDGSAKDINGNALHEPGGVGGGSGVSTVVRLESGNIARFTTAGSAHYIVCGYVGGKLVNCYKQ